MPGAFSSEEVRCSWPDFDCAVHVPLSENCGGVVEPLRAGVPTVAARVGGLPEVVIDGVTGTIVSRHNPVALAEAVLTVLDNSDLAARQAAIGQKLVSAMFDIRRTSSEVLQVYKHILYGDPIPSAFCADAEIRKVTV